MLVGLVYVFEGLIYGILFLLCICNTIFLWKLQEV